LENARKTIALKVPAKATVWYIGSSAAARLIGAMSSPIFTRLLSAEEFGIFSLYSSWVGVLSVLVTLEITGNVIYRGFQEHEDKKEEFASAALGLLGTLFVGFCTLYFAFYSFIQDFIELSLGISIFMMLEIFGAAVISLYLAKAKFEYKYKSVSVLNVISAVAIPFFAVLLILLTKIRAEARIYTSSLVTLAIAVPIVFILVKRADKLYSREIWGYLLKRSIPLLPHYLAAALILRAAEISIGKNHGTAALGQYSIAMSVGMILTIVTGGILSALAPWMIRKIRDGAIGKIREFLLLITRALGLLALLVLAAAPELLSFLAADGFRSALPSVYPLEIAAIFSFLSGAVMSASTYFKKGGLSSLASVGTAAVSVLFAFLLLPRIDYRWAGVFALICYLLMTLFASFIFKRLSGEFPIDLKKTALIFIFTVVYAAILYMFRGAIVSRIFLAMPILALLLMTAKEVYLAVKE
jgi:O-antigen/teichoic acid export membrane protein